MVKKNCLQIIVLVITSFFLSINFCYGPPKKSRTLDIITQYGPVAAKIATPIIGSKIKKVTSTKKEVKEQVKPLKERIESRKKIKEEEAKTRVKMDVPPEIDSDEEIKRRIQESPEVKELNLMEAMRASLEKARTGAEAKIYKAKEKGEEEKALAAWRKLSEVKEAEEKLEEEFNKKLEPEEAEEESGGLGIIGKTGLTTVTTAGIGGLTTGLTSAGAGTLFAVSQGMQEDEEEVFLETEAGEIEEESISEDEVQDEEASPEIHAEKEVKKIEPKPEESIIGGLISGAKEVAGEAAEVAAISMATGEQKKEMLEEIKEDEKREEKAEKKKAEAKKQEKPTEEKKKPLRPLDTARDQGERKEKEEKKIKGEQEKISTFAKATADKMAAKQEVLKVISLPEDMVLSSKEAESLLSILANHVEKELKKSSKLFANDEKEKSFTTISGETISVVGKDFSKPYLEKFQADYNLYKQAEAEYKELLKKKKSGEWEEADEAQLVSNKRYYEEMKDKAQKSFIEKQTAINSRALYYPSDKKPPVFKIIQEGVKIIKKHTPEKFEEIDLLKIFEYLKPLDIESKDILPDYKVSVLRQAQDDREIEEELFNKTMADKQKEVTKRLEKEKSDGEARLSKEQEDVEMLRKKRELEFEAVEERLKQEQEDIKKRRQQEGKELEEFGKKQSFWN